jgi:hypothetical protein
LLAPLKKNISTKGLWNCRSFGFDGMTKGRAVVKGERQSKGRAVGIGRAVAKVESGS